MHTLARNTTLQRKQRACAWGQADTSFSPGKCAEALLAAASAEGQLAASAAAGPQVPRAHLGLGPPSTALDVPEPEAPHMRPRAVQVMCLSTV